MSQLPPTPYGAHGTLFHLNLLNPTAENIAQLMKMQPRAAATGFIRTSGEAAKWISQAGKCRHGNCFPILFMEDSMKTWWDALLSLASPESALVYLDESQGEYWMGRAYGLADLYSPSEFLVQARCRNGITVKSFEGPEGLRVPILTAIHMLHEPQLVSVAALAA